jgi:hypothetical protein
VLFGFFDGSGTHDDARICGIAGLIGEDTTLVPLHHKWKSVIEDPQWPSPITEFHTVDCVNQTREFRDWPYAERLALYGNMATIVAETPGILAIGCAVVCGHLFALPASDLELFISQGLGTPTDLTFQQTIQRIIHRTHEYDEGARINLIFDEEPADRAERYHSLFNHYQSGYPVKGHLAGIAFVNSVDFPVLQAADLIAYTTMRWLTEKVFPETAEPWFPIVPAFLRMIEGINADGGYYDSGSLGALVSNVRRGEIMQ